jgi:hypothetical protein
MAQFNPMEPVLCGGTRSQTRQKYFSYDGDLYTGTFPIVWLTDHLPGTGPKECANCSAVGRWNGVFIGYCMNCSGYTYEGKRGRGFKSAGKESTDEDLIIYKSAFDTYLKGINLDDIGDKDFMDSAALCEAELEMSQEKVDAEEALSEANRIQHYECTAADDSDDDSPILRVIDANKKGETPVRVDIPLQEEEVSDSDEDSEAHRYERFEYEERGCGYSYGSNYDGGYDSY